MTAPFLRLKMSSAGMCLDLTGQSSADGRIHPYSQPNGIHALLFQDCK